MSFCSYVKKKCTQKSQKYTEFCSACFCGCLRRLRETITLRTAFCEFRGYRVRLLPTRKALCSYVKKVAHRNHRNTQNFAPHASAKSVCMRLFHSARILCLPCLLCETTPRRLCETLRLCVRRKYLLLSKKLHTEITEIHRILLRMLLRMSAPSA